MTQCRALGKGFLAFGVGAVLIVAAILPNRTLAATDAGQFLTSFGERAVKELNDESLNETQRETRFRELFNEAVDVPAIGRFILGTHWRTATPQEREDFLVVFEDIALQRFLPLFTHQSDEYDGNSFEITEIRHSDSNKKHIFVHAVVGRAEGEPARLVWRVRQRDGQFKILDITVEGISMVLALREEYGSAINQTGSVEGLVELMREKIQSGAFAPPTSASATN